MEAAVTVEGQDTDEVPSLREIMDKVKFSVEQMSRICGVSRRQLSYWTKKGILVGDDGYALATVEKVLLIRQELDNKTSLRRAVQKVEAYLERRTTETRRLEAMPEDELRALAVDLLRRLQSSIRALRESTHVSSPTTTLRGLAIDLETLQMETLFQPPNAQVTLPLLTARLNLTLERFERMLALLREREAARA